LGGTISKTVADLLRFFLETNQKVFGFEGAPLHDPITIGYLIDPDILTTRFLNVEVETTSKLTRGKIAADVYNVTGNAHNADVSMKLDLPRFKKMVFDAVEKYDR
jgi:inosine-uridine nucleoside N-ribohydrolase